MRRKRLIGPVIMVFVLSFIVPIPVANADKTEKLIEILIRKGVISSEDAQALRDEVQKEEDVQQRSEARQPEIAREKQPVQAAAPAKIEEKEAQRADWTKNVIVGYDKGAFIRTADDLFSLKVNVGLEPMFSYEASGDEEDSSTFRFRRARFYAQGNAFYPWLKYYTQITLEGGSVALRDAFLEATYLSWLQPRAGQFKVPFDREFLTSGFELELIERSIASSEFSLQRDLGAQFTGNVLNKRLSYAVGIFNGSGANQNNVDDNYMYVGRLVWTPFGPYPYSQGALDTPEHPRFALGIGGAYLPGLDPGERRTLAGVLGSSRVVPVESDVYELVGDIAFKYLNLSLEAGYFFRNIDPERTTPHGSEDAHGLYAQAGYFLLPKRLQLAARYSYVDPDNPVTVGGNDQHEATVGATYYLLGHRLKAQLNYTFLNTQGEPDDIQDHILRTAMILVF